MKWFNNLLIQRKLLLSFVIVLILAIGAGTFSVMEMRAINKSYSSAMEHSNDIVDNVFLAQAHYANAQMIMREIFYPGNTRADLTSLSEELNVELELATAKLNNAYPLASDEVKSEIGVIMPKIEQYRTDSQATINYLLAVGNISISNPEYREAVSIAESREKATSETYASEMSVTIDSLSDMTLADLEVLAKDLGDKANHVMYIVIGLLVLMALLTVGMALYIAGLISKPLVVFSKFMKKAGETGDLSFSDEDIEVISTVAQNKDELGIALNGAAAFVNNVKNISKELGTIASGDLSVEIKTLSEKDEMGISLNKMVDSYKNMFQEIHVSSVQVATGSRNIADGAQSLAQGSTEQAAAIEELSASINEIAERTKENAETAEKTAVLSSTIIENAEKGSQRMDEMIVAVKEINEASQSISKIISTINEIAFQTNILALNAAVEAARAGVHGKGFAVVADEVRNLASMSADAAKDTGGMIKNTIKKAEQGSRIAGETADSLAEIVSGVNESNQLIAEIAKASEGQAVGIGQINIGIDQVAMIVQLNSATAEESAAASEEMSSHAQILEELLEQFKLEGDDKAGTIGNGSFGEEDERLEKSSYHTKNSPAYSLGL